MLERERERICGAINIVSLHMLFPIPFPDMQGLWRITLDLSFVPTAHYNSFETVYLSYHLEARAIAKVLPWYRIVQLSTCAITRRDH